MSLVLAFSIFESTWSFVSQQNALLLITLVCWGIWGIFDKQALERSSHLDVFLVMVLLEVPQIPVLAALLQLTQPGWQICPQLVFWSALSAVLFALNMATYLVALSRSEASYVLGLTAGYPLVSQILAVTFLGEQLVPGRLFGALLIATGVFAIGFSPDSTRIDRGRVQHRTGLQERLFLLACVVIATITWGLKGLIDKKALNLGTPLEVMLIEVTANSTVLIPLIAIFIWRQHKPLLTDKKMWKFATLSTLALAIGGLAYLAALKRSTASYVITVTGCYPLIMYLFALWTLNERLDKLRLIGIALVALGGIVVQLVEHR
jgi:drug/metabolite transporter (DMT)-like permease